MKVASTVRGGGHATPFGPTVPTLPFQWLIRQFEERMIVFSDTAFHATEGDPSNLKLCQRGEWQDRLLVETVLSMLTLVAESGKRDCSRPLLSEPDVK